MQAAFQEFNDSAISKTCNFAHDATEEYVEEIYRLAYQLNCKGVTVYRDGSRDMQVLSTGSTAKKVQEQATASGTAEARRPELASGEPRAAADLHGEIAELRAENERLRRMRARARGREPPAAPEALAARAAARHHPAARDAARHALRHDHRGRPAASRSRSS